MLIKLLDYTVNYVENIKESGYIDPRILDHGTSSRSQHHGPAVLPQAQSLYGHCGEEKNLVSYRNSNSETWMIQAVGSRYTG
jgi:hypothetical protein